MIYSDGWCEYNGLIEVGYSKQFRVNYGANEFTHGTCYINGIESFWSFTKRCLIRFNEETCYSDLHLKKSEWRWKKLPDELAKELSKLISKL